MPQPPNSRGNSITTPRPALSEKAARELAKLKSELDALASADGFAPTRDEFILAAHPSTPPFRRFFSGYDEFIRSCGYKSATDRRREMVAAQRAAQWQAQSQAQSAARESPISSPAPTVANSQSADTTAHTNNQSLPQPIASHTSHASHPTSGGGEVAPRSGHKPRTNEMFYGDPIHCCDMAHAPVNEQGVVLLFGILAKKLKYRIEMVRTGYPDCEAKRQGLDGKWRRVRIEFEFLTSRFNHDPAGCDLIVCWKDDKNPTNLEVLELKNHVGREPGSEPVSPEPPIAAPSDQCVSSAALITPESPRPTRLTT